MRGAHDRTGCEVAEFHMCRLESLLCAQDERWRAEKHATEELITQIKPNPWAHESFAQLT